MNAFQSVALVAAILVTPSLVIWSLYTLRANRRERRWRAALESGNYAACLYCPLPIACPHCDTCAWHCDATATAPDYDDAA